MNSQVRDALLERLAFELWRVDFPDTGDSARASATFEQWRQVWGTGTNAVRYRRCARRVLELLELGDQHEASLTVNGGVKSLRLGLGVETSERRRRR